MQFCKLELVPSDFTALASKDPPSHRPRYWFSIAWFCQCVVKRVFCSIDPQHPTLKRAANLLPVLALVDQLAKTDANVPGFCNGEPRR
jgi:hypothetical protein